MIIRARPKYLDNIKDFNDVHGCQINQNEFYFTSGRAALKFYLIYLANKKNKTLSIAMQSFNCNVVADSALEANCEIYLLDIKLSDFSISLDSIKEIAQHIDVLLLTHYQGIPNLEYFEIIEFCNSKEIIVIEDIAQSFGSTINNVKIGTLGNVSISSYAFDKPFSSFNGGKLEIILKDDDLHTINKLYLSLDYELETESSLDIQLLSYLYKYTTSKYYRRNIDNYSILKVLLKLKLPFKMIYILSLALEYRIINKIINKIISFISKNKNIVIQKLNNNKISLIKNQEKNYFYDLKKTYFIEELCKENDIPFINAKNLEIHWNRYSILDDRKVLSKLLLEKNIQVGNFNWGTPLDKIYNHNKKVHIMSNLDNSSFASRNIINIPIWSYIDDK